MLMLLTRGDRLAAQELWLRKVRIHLEAPQGAGASAPKAAQQVAGRRPKPAPARAQAVPKPRTAAQIARHERSQKQLRQKHLARKMWASVRIASRLLAWRIRAHALSCERTFFVNHPGLCSSMVLGRLMVMPIRVGKLLVQQWPSARARRPPPAALPAPPTSSAAAAQLLPAPALAAPPPPSQQPHLALAAAARASLDACEMQDDRGAKRDALASTPPRPAAPLTLPPSAEPARKKPARRGLGSAIAAAAPAAAAPQPLTATSYHPAALAAANPYHLLA